MLWILIVSLPLQGIAAVMIFPCTMSMAHTRAANSHGADMDDCDDPDMMVEMAQPKAQQDAAADVSHQDMPCGKDLHQKPSSCRTCSACYVGASAPPPVYVAEPTAAHFTNNYIRPASSFTGWIPFRIERPPRL
jgi:hypothetical protein